MFIYERSQLSFTHYVQRKHCNCFCLAQSESIEQRLYYSPACEQQFCEMWRYFMCNKRRSL
jgi:hypothetical protein